jgi:hypothetical protein
LLKIAELIQAEFLAKLRERRVLLGRSMRNIRRVHQSFAYLGVVRHDVVSIFAAQHLYCNNPGNQSPPGLLPSTDFCWIISKEILSHELNDD